MTALATVAALVVALVLQTALGRLWPGSPPFVDFFLLVVVYAGVTRGETRGMLTGTAAGWIQDIQFGGPVTGFSAFTKLIVGFVAGFAGSRFLLVAAVPRLLLLACASLFDALLFERLAALLGAPVPEVSLAGLALRAALTALVGVPVFHALDQRLPRGAAA